VAPIHSARAEIIAQSQDPDGNLRVDGVGGDTELRGDLRMGEAVDPAEGQHVTTARRKGLDSLGEQLEFLIMADGFGHTGPIIKDGQEVDFS